MPRYAIRITDHDTETPITIEQDGVDEALAVQAVLADWLAEQTEAGFAMAAIETETRRRWPGLVVRVTAYGGETHATTIEAIGPAA